MCSVMRDIANEYDRVIPDRIGIEGDTLRVMSAGYELARSTVLGWRSIDMVTYQAVTTLETFLKRVNPNKATKRQLSIAGSQHEHFDLPPSFTVDIAIPIAQLLTSSCLQLARVVQKDPLERILSPVCEQLLEVFASFVVPLAIGLIPMVNGMPWTDRQLAYVLTHEVDCPDVLCLLQPIFCGIEVMLKNVTFHTEEILSNGSQSHAQQARKVFSLVSSQLPSVASFAGAFPSKVPSHRPLRPIVIASYCISIDQLVRNKLLSRPHIDCVGIVSVFDAFLEYARTSLEDFDFISTGKHGCWVPGGGAVLTSGEESPLRQALDSALTYIEGSLNNSETRPSWRSQRLSKSFSIPLPSSRLARSGRAVVNILSMFELIDRLNGKTEEVRNSFGEFVESSIRYIREALEAALDDLSGSERGSLLVEALLQLHFDITISVQWGEEWLERTDGSSCTDATNILLDALRLDRDRCLRLLADTISDIISSAALEGSSLQQGQLLAAKFGNLQKLHFGSPTWGLLRAAVVSKSAERNPSIAALIASVFEVSV